MKNFLIIKNIFLLLISYPVLANEGFYDNFLKKIETFSFDKGVELYGFDDESKKCEIKVTLRELVFYTSGIKYFSDNSIEDVHIYSSSSAEQKWLRLRVDGDRSNGLIEFKVRETIEAHKTDFGFPILRYQVDYSARLVFKQNRLIEATLIKRRPGLSQFIPDPDYRGDAKIIKCKETI